jgi:hypothetical protein
MPADLGKLFDAGSTVMASTIGRTARSGQTRPDLDELWFISGRLQQYQAEARANLLRIIGVGSFYVIELLNYHGFNLGAFELEPTVDRPFHLAATALAVAWSMFALGTMFCLKWRVFPKAMKTITTAADLLLLTAILLVADGPRSPLVVGYFLIIALASLRIDLRLVRFATVGAMAGYVVLLGYAKWFAERDVRVPRYEELIVLLALALTGILLGQVIRQVRFIADDYARRVAAVARES